jgi:hypothetical protein
MTGRAEKPEKTESTWRTVGAVLGIIVGVITVLGIVFGIAFSSRIETNAKDITNVRVDLQGHKDNTGIHRTAEEGKERERGERVWRDLLMDRLQSIDKRLERLETRR